MEQKIERISCETAVGEKEVSLFRIPNSTNDFIELSTLGCTLKSICVHGPDGQMQELLAQPGTSLVQMEGLSDTLSKTVWEVAEVGDQHVFLTCCVQVPEGCEITLGAKILWVNLNRLVVDLYMTPAGEVTLAPSTSVYYKSNVTQASSVRTFCPSCMEDGAWKNTVDTAFKELTFLPLQKAEQFADPEVKDVRPMLELTEMTEAMPMMAERTLIVVTDFDLYKLGEEQRTRLIALLDDFPEYCCLIFVYDLVEYKPNKTYKKLYAALSDKAQEVRFEPQDKSDLINWIARRFRATGHDIDARTAEHLMFTCGSLMTGLVPEIEKIGAYAKGEVITQRDIDAVADPVLSAEIFKMTDAVSQSDYNKAAAILGDLLKMQEEPIVILAALGSQLRRLYTARMAIDSGKDKYWLMELWEMRSDYPAKLLLQSAKRVSAQWCGDAVKMCQVVDLRMKSQRGVDPAEELKLLLARLGAARK